MLELRKSDLNVPKLKFNDKVMSMSSALHLEVYFLEAGEEGSGNAKKVVKGYKIPDIR